MCMCIYCMCMCVRVCLCCVRVRSKAEQECQHCVTLMCQMSEESVSVSAPRGSQGVKTPIMLCLDACHYRHTADMCMRCHLTEEY